VLKGSQIYTLDFGILSYYALKLYSEQVSMIYKGFLFYAVRFVVVLGLIHSFIPLL